MARLKIHLCSEVVRDLAFRDQCRFARDAGYDGLEVAPFTLAEDPTRMDASRIREFRDVADGEGVPISGLHWLLAAPAGLSITSGDPTVAAATRDAGSRLVDLCAALGGGYLVHGSPGQRVLAPGHEAEGRAHAADYFAAMAAASERAGVDYIVEPLAKSDTGLVNSVEEALAMIEAIGSPSLKTMVDCYAASANGEDVPKLLARWLPKGALAHIHFNDDNKREPGQGGLDFRAILATLKAHGYAGAAAVEPFVYEPDGPTCAARAIGHLRGLESKGDRA